MSDIALSEIVRDAQSCKGLFFRGYANFFFDGRTAQRKEGVRLLKKMSCSGCPQCGWFYEDYCNGTEIILPRIEHGALYTLKVTNVKRDWETGFIDGYDVEFVKIDELEAKL